MSDLSCRYSTRLAARLSTRAHCFVWKALCSCHLRQLTTSHEADSASFKRRAWVHHSMLFCFSKAVEEWRLNGSTCLERLWFSPCILVFESAKTPVAGEFAPTVSPCLSLELAAKAPRRFPSLLRHKTITKALERQRSTIATGKEVSCLETGFSNSITTIGALRRREEAVSQSKKNFTNARGNGLRTFSGFPPTRLSSFPPPEMPRQQAHRA